MMYAYDFTLFKRAVVATFDLSAQNLAMFTEDHWLSNEQNVLVLRLDAPAWLCGPAPGLAVLSTPPVLTHKDQMTKWRVEGVIAFFKARDMDATASLVKQNDINGSDLFGLSEAELTGTLRATGFLARKIIRVRDAFLNE